MHSDLLLLRVACRVVEGSLDATVSGESKTHHPQGNVTSPLTTNATASTMPRIVLPALTMAPVSSTSSSSSDARRIPVLSMPSAPPLGGLTTHAADLMLGLKRLGTKRAANDELSSLSSHKRAREDHREMRVRLPAPPGVFLDSPLAALLHGKQRSHGGGVNAQLPLPPMRSPLGVDGVATTDDKSHARAATSTFMAFMGRQLPAASTTNASDSDSGSEDDQDTLSPLESPRIAPQASHAHTTTLRVPTLPQWRAPTLLPSGSANLLQKLQKSPLPPITSTCSSSSARQPSMPPLSLSSGASTKPTLVRKSSAPWRQAMALPDRQSTRERILRGLHSQSQGNYEALLTVVAAMEEELLHLHTTSKDHYFLQTVALRDRIESVTPPATVLPTWRTPAPH